MFMSGLPRARGRGHGNVLKSTVSSCQLCFTGTLRPGPHDGGLVASGSLCLRAWRPHGGRWACRAAGELDPRALGSSRLNSD